MNSALVTEEVIVSDSLTRSESSIDSALDVSQAKYSRPIPLTLHSKSTKLDSDFGNPPSVFTRVTSKGFVSRKRSEGAQDDQLIGMSPSKRKRFGCELKRQSLNDLFDPLASDVVSSERTSEDPAFVVFHECPIELDSKVKRVEDDAEVPHSGKPESETVTGGQPEKILEDPHLDKEDPEGSICCNCVSTKSF